jgi:hypothetical protein
VPRVRQAFSYASRQGARGPRSPDPSLDGGGVAADRRRPHGLQPLFGESPGGLERGDRARLTCLEDPAERLSDPVHERVQPHPVEGMQLAVHVDQTPGVGDEVGGVEDLPLGETIRQRALGEHVVRGAADDLASQPLDILGVDRPAQRAWRQELALGGDRVGGLEPASTQPLGELALGRVDVGDAQLGSVGGEALRQPRADMA